jgi:pyruvate dehydrogenase E2 component (dihydrolipoamide acetyltransferase)
MAHAKASANPNDFILPDLGEGVHEAELIAWKVQVGQQVAEHDILAEMETDKALVEVPSPRSGVIATLHGKPGEILRVGNPLVTYAGGGSAPAAPAEPKAESRKSKPDHHGSANGSATAPATEESREDAGTVVGSMGGELGGVSAGAGKVLATPAVRRLARDLGVDINSIQGSGIGGRVTEKDVRSTQGGGRTQAPSRARGGHSDVAPMEPEEPHSGAALVTRAGGGVSAPSRAPSAPPAKREVAHIPQGQDTVRIPFRGVRRTIANRLRESVNQAVHFNVMDEADVSILDNLRKKLAAASGEKVSFLPFVASAVCRVLTRAEFRAMNATVDERPSDANYEASIVQHRAVHLGIATDTDSGLMVPVIRDCDALGVLEIGREIAGIAAAARSRSIPREQLVGSTFTIVNVGSHAGRFATPIINYPEVGILAVGRGRQAPVIRSTAAGPAFAIGQLLPLSLACDHRVVDGATAALALAEIVKLLQEPEQLLGPARG